MIHESRNPQKLQNPMPTLKSVERAYFSLCATKFQAWALLWSGINSILMMKMSAVSLQRNVNQKFQRLLHGLYPVQKQIWIQKQSHRKNRKSNKINFFPFCLLSTLKFGTSHFTKLSWIAEHSDPTTDSRGTKISQIYPCKRVDFCHDSCLSKTEISH